MARDLWRLRRGLAVLLAVGWRAPAAAQHGVEIAVPPAVQERMAAALKQFNAGPEPAWCRTPELRQQRQVIVEKCIRTLYHNYQPVAGDIRHEGVVPSPAAFNGLWFWDSWKHAYALAGLDRALAENSVRALFDYQDADGMVADNIKVDKAQGNFRDTKPPLSVWAVHRIYTVTRDLAFVQEMYPRLLKYHDWWYRHRDHDRNGLCEYGAVGNDRQAAAWESGWDNVIRFDGARMVKNGERAWSMDIESVDLNAYLYLEKKLLQQLALVLQDAATAARLAQEQTALGRKIQQTFFDPQSGFFFDVRLADKSFVPSREASGWLPLFAGAATPEQAARVRDLMMDEAVFNTYVPLPTAAKDNPRRNPEGYWRGPVWLDQFYFGYQGLKNYGYHQDAEALLLKLLQHAAGLTRPDGLLREQYHPDNGAGQGATMFGWTAAHLLMMMAAEPAPEPALAHPIPPRGWNSYTGYSIAVTEAELLKNIDFLSERLLPYGYDTVTVDNGWFLSGQGAGVTIALDACGRPEAHPHFFPHGLQHTIDYAHQRGVKFGIWLLRGINRRAVAENLPVEGTPYHMQDIVNKKSACPWAAAPWWNYGVDMTKPGAQEYYDGLVRKYAGLGVDFIKFDDIVPNPPEVAAVAQAIKKCGRPMVLSLSPGDEIKVEHSAAYKQANMVRITSDIWDNKGSLETAFKRWEAMQHYTGPEVGSFLDMDMVCFGRLYVVSPDGGWECKFTPDQKRTFMVQRALAASPLMLGGVLYRMDDFSLRLFTHPDILQCNRNGVIGRLVHRDGKLDVWKTPERGRDHCGWLGIFNRDSARPATCRLALQDWGLDAGRKYTLQNLWTHCSLPVADEQGFEIPADGVVFLRYAQEPQQ